MTDHLTPVGGTRKGRIMPALPDLFSDDVVRVTEAAMDGQPCIWLRILDTPSAEDGTTQGVACLPAPVAWQLKEQIEWLLRHHDLGDARPKDNAA